MDWSTVLTALIGGGVTLLGAIVSSNRAQAVMEVKLDALKEQVEKHNQVMERTYRLENDVTKLDVRLSAVEREQQHAVKIGGTE